MKHPRSAVRQAPEADPYIEDETMAMVYVGDGYSLVAQEGSVVEPAKEKVEKPDELPDDDSLWPLIR